MKILLSSYLWSLFLFSIFACSDNGNTSVNDDNENNSFWLSINSPSSHSTLIAINSLDYIYAYFPDSGLYYSINNGESWQNIVPISFLEITVLKILADNRIIIGGVGQLIYISEDFGETWKSNQYTDIISLATCIYQTFNKKIIIGCTSGIYLADETLNNWISFDTGLTTDISTDFIENDQIQLLCATASEGLFIFNDTNKEWEKKSWGITSNNLTILTKDYQGTLFCGTTDNSVFRSIDGGIHWNIVDKGLPQKITSIVINEEGNVFAGTFYGVYRLSEGSDLWKALDNDLNNSVARDLAINSKGYVYMATDSGIYRSGTSTLLGTIDYEN